MDTLLSPAAKAPNDFAQLRLIIQEHGLLRRQPAYFITKIVVTGLLLAGAVLSLFLAKNLFLVLLAAAAFAFTYGQIGLLGHDAGHRQIFARAWKDMVIGYVCCLLVGVSHKRWVEKHNQHHAHPNTEDMDPDIDFPVLAFSEEQARAKKGIFRFIVRHQAILFFPMLCFVFVTLRVDAIVFLLRKPFLHAWLDSLLFVGHFVLYLALVFLLLTPLHGVVFILVHQALFGLYMGLVFAPNHKGMPVLAKDAKIDFLREQVLTSRNVRSHPLIDFWYGGLNYQIEHHLFPTMPRKNLKQARTIVKQFCADKNIPYYETSMYRSYVEILSYMHRVAAPCRA